MVSGIILRTFMIFIYISDENKIRDKTTKAKTVRHLTPDTTQSPDFCLPYFTSYTYILYHK